jgi:hypothetical protein
MHAASAISKMSTTDAPRPPPRVADMVGTTARLAVRSRAARGLALATMIVSPSMPSIAAAQQIAWHGFLDLRVAHAASNRSFLDGGDGRLRSGGSDVQAGLTQAALVGSMQLTPSLLALGNLQLQAAGDADIDLVEAYLRWRPVSTSRSRWSLQAGAFFPPVSFENDAIGWTSRWTLTSSAINTWVGEELRTIGTAAGYEWRGDASTLEATAALYTGNDPAGEILFARGWALTDVSCGIGCRLREPDAAAAGFDEQPPRRYNPYAEIDGRVGWYAGLRWDARGRGRIALLRYDNNADGSTSEIQGRHEIDTWDTRFWSVAAQADRDDIVLIAQLMHGTTFFAPSAFFRSSTQFDAGYLLVGWNRGRWRPALRVDLFHTREHPSAGEGAAEQGRALTLALNWRPQPRLRLSAELVQLVGRRHHPDLAPGRSTLDDAQLQLNARLLF